jgi:hypothetical protein
MSNNDGLNVKISKDDFLKLPQGEQNWALFAGITKIDREGCTYGKDAYHKHKLNRLQIMGAAIGGGLGFAVAMGKAFGFF